MEGKENILEELRLVSGFVAAISRVTPYGLPDGYFDRLADRILDRLRAEALLRKQELAGPEESQDASGPGAGIPDFSGSGSDFLKSGSSAPAYSVPTGYFEGFAEKLMGRIKAGQEGGNAREELALLSPLLSRIDKKMPFEVPQGYFDDLSGTMVANIGGAPGNTGAETLSPLLAGLKDKQVYQAPKGYFESFPDQVLGKIKEDASDKPAVSGKQPGMAKVISSRTRSWWKYSAAAAVAGLILTGGWLWTHTSVGTGTGSIDITKSLPTVSDQEIESFLDTNNVTNNTPLADAVANSTASLDDLTDNDIRSFLGDVPDGELKEYIDEHGDVQNPATN